MVLYAQVYCEVDYPRRIGNCKKGMVLYAQVYCEFTVVNVDNLFHGMVLYAQVYCEDL